MYNIKRFDLEQLKTVGDCKRMITDIEFEIVTLEDALKYDIANLSLVQRMKTENYIYELKQLLMDITNIEYALEATDFYKVKLPEPLMSNYPIYASKHDGEPLKETYTSVDVIKEGSESDEAFIYYDSITKVTNDEVDDFFRKLKLEKHISDYLNQINNRIVYPAAKVAVLRR